MSWPSPTSVPPQCSLEIDEVAHTHSIKSFNVRWADAANALVRTRKVVSLLSHACLEKTMQPLYIHNCTHNKGSPRGLHSDGGCFTDQCDGRGTVYRRNSIKTKLRAIFKVRQISVNHIFAGDEFGMQTLDFNSNQWSLNVYTYHKLSRECSQDCGRRHIEYGVWRKTPSSAFARNLPD